MSNVISLEHFQKAVTALGGGRADALHAKLLNAWAEPARRYHTPQHLEECLTLAERWGAHLHQRVKAMLVLGLWLHDAVYDPQGQQNERKSADLARVELALAGVPTSAISRVEQLVMATDHSTPSPAGDALVDLLLDIDLAILGANAERFAEYEAQVRDEYRWVSDAEYAVGRGKVMAHFRALAFSEPQTLFRTTAGRTLIEQARRNLTIAQG